MSRRRVQLLVVGSGFAGSLMAMIGRRLGLATAMVERGRHPRFVIGESSTPLANLLLEEIACDYDLAGVRPLCKWGTWQKNCPHLACGLKRGFTFYHHELSHRFKPDPGRRRQLLVGASPREAIADTHWYRPTFDHYLVQQAHAAGVEYYDEVELAEAVEEMSGMRVSGKRRGEPVEFSCDFLIDATGPRGFLHRALRLPEKQIAGFPATQALFSHFVDVAPLPDSFVADGLTPPYPPEDAAVHHIFPGGWIWVLKFNNGVTSAGVAAIEPIAKAFEFQSGEPGWRGLLKQLPSIAEIFESSGRAIPFVYQPRVAFQSGVVSGPHWTLLPSAAGVVDPLLSTGFPLTLLGVSRLGHLLASHWQQPAFQEGLHAYAEVTTLELEATGRLVGALYATMERFELFKALSLLYFAAASFSECARRLGKSSVANSFLLCRHPVFSARVRQFCDRVRQTCSPGESSDLERQIYESIEPFDVAELTDKRRHPWYPALIEDIVRNASKLGASCEDIDAMLKKCDMIEPKSQ